MRIAIVGAGAIGCYLGAQLKSLGHAVTLVGRPAQVAAITRDGLLLRLPDGTTRRSQLRAVETLDERPELVLLTVKTQDVTAACQQIAPICAGVPVVAMQNGVRGDALAADVLGREVVLGAVVMIAAAYLQPGEVDLQFAGWMVVGEAYGPARPRTREIVALLGGAIPTYLTQHLDRVRWSKLVSNLNNGLCAATGQTLPELVATPLGLTLSARLMREGVRVAHAAGVRLDHGLYGLTPQALRRDRTAALVALGQASMGWMLGALPEGAAMRLLAAASRSRLGQIPLRGSTWQSIARGRPSEIAYLNGEIVRQGALLGVATPYNSRLIEVVREVEQSGRAATVERLLPAGQMVATPAAKGGGA